MNNTNEMQTGGLLSPEEITARREAREHREAMQADRNYICKIALDSYAGLFHWEELVSLVKLSSAKDGYIHLIQEPDRIGAIINSLLDRPEVSGWRISNELLRHACSIEPVTTEEGQNHSISITSGGFVLIAVFKYSGIPAWYRKMYANADSRFSDFARDMLSGLQKSPIYQALAAVEFDPELLEQSGNNSIKSEIGWKRTDDAFIIEASGLYVGETMFVCRTLANIFRRSRPQ